MKCLKFALIQCWGLGEGKQMEQDWVGVSLQTGNEYWASLSSPGCFVFMDEVLHHWKGGVKQVKSCLQHQHGQWNIITCGYVRFSVRLITAPQLEHSAPRRHPIVSASSANFPSLLSHPFLSPSVLFPGSHVAQTRLYMLSCLRWLHTPDPPGSTSWALWWQACTTILGLTRCFYL